MMCRCGRYFFMSLIMTCRKLQCFCMNASGFLNDFYYRYRCLSVMDCMWSSPIWLINYLSIYKVLAVTGTHKILFFCFGRLSLWPLKLNSASLYNEYIYVPCPQVFGADKYEVLLYSLGDRVLAHTESNCPTAKTLCKALLDRTAFSGLAKTHPML